MIVIRDIKEKEMTIFNPDGSILVITQNMLCVNDILLQIKEQALEGYSICIENQKHCKITKYGRIKGVGFGEIYANQLYQLTFKNL